MSHMRDIKKLRQTRNPNGNLGLMNRFSQPNTP